MTVAKAKDTLLRALEKLEEAESELEAEPDRVDLIVIYSIGHDTGDAWESVDGWAATAGPKWMHAAMLYRAADANANAARADDDD
jgi:hypothetical protein